MKIAVFSECYTPIVNGVVVAVSTLCREILRSGHQVCLFAPAFGGYREEEPFVYRYPSLTFPTNPRYPLGIPYTPPRLQRVINEFSPDIVHAHSLFGMGRAGAKIAARRNIPLIFTYHTLIEAYTHYIPLPQPLVKAIARKISRAFANRADYVIAPGPAAEAALRRYGVSRPISVIPTGADLSLADLPSSPEILGRWQIPAGAPLICFAGRIAREKNLELVLAAFLLVLKKFPEAQLIFAGGGPWQEQLRARIAALKLGDRARVTGFLPRSGIFEILKQSKIFAFPSLTDTQGIVVIEGMSCGLPVVAVSSGAVAEVLREGKEGLLVEPQAEDFAAALVKLLDNETLRRALGEQAKDRAQEFSAARCARQVIDLYRQAARNHRPR
jgi:1,2-diacylglycerol 3-alpha-glucosyltransferase